MLDMYRYSRRNSTLMLGLLAVLGLGCGSGGPATVDAVIEGMVTYQGEPVREGTVALVNATGNAGGQAAITPEGRFELDKRLPPGTYSVSVIPPMIDVPGNGMTAPGKVTKEVNNIPWSYRSSSTSGITLPVQAGENDLKIEMK